MFVCLFAKWCIRNVKCAKYGRVVLTGVVYTGRLHQSGPRQLNLQAMVGDCGKSRYDEMRFYGIIIILNSTGGYTRAPVIYRFETENFMFEVPPDFA